MAPCPRCGTENPPAQPLCARCGAQLVGPGGPMASTMALGGVPPTHPDFPPLEPSQGPRAPVPQTWPDAPAQAPPAAGPAPKADHKRTMMGIAPVAPTATPAPPPAAEAFAPAAAKRTMLGIAPPSIPHAPPMAEPAAAAHKQTMMGIAPVSLPHAQAPPAETPPPEAAPRPVQSQLKTKMGIAHPGIAPLAPSVAKPVPAPRSARVASNAELRPEDLAVLPGRQRRSSTGLLIALALGGAFVLLAIAVGIAIWWRSGPPISARAEVDQSGRERLLVSCDPPCPYTRVRAGSQTAELVDGKATLALDRPLSIGDNEIAVELEEADGSRHSVEVGVPVAYRLKTDFSALGEPTPRAAVQVEAEPGAAVVVDGHPVALDDQGRGRHAIDVSADLTGIASKVVPLERKVPYSVTRRGADPERGELTLRIGVAPLVVDAPGESIVIEAPNFTLAGSTQKGGAVSVGGRPITVDPAGRFAQLMNVSSVGETTIVVRATAPDLAPRLVPIRVKRVASLDTEAERFAAKATRAYSAIADGAESKRGVAVALDGEVVEARSEGHVSVLLFDAASGCPSRPCLARVIHGARVAFERGARVTVYGHLTGSVDGPRTGAKIPEIRADFLRARGKP